MSARPPRKDYSEQDIERALAVVAGHRGNVSRAARELGIPIGTLTQWSKGARRLPATEKAREARETTQAVQRARLSREWHILARKALKQATKGLSEASSWEAARIAGLSVDKMTALSGGFQQRSEVVVSMADYFRQALGKPAIDVQALPMPKDESEQEQIQVAVQADQIAGQP